ncbi:MAG: hypothetical protein JXI43_06340 [Tissierellales bacterium]|nr:hypothetical protein [Tissierellales bacterium]
MSQTVEYPAHMDKQGNLMRFRKAYDNGGKTVDRYTVTFEIYNEVTGKWDVYSWGTNTDAPEGHPDYKKIYCLGMSEKPFNPRGFGQSGSCVEGRHLGKRIKYSELPEEVKKCILQYMES